MEKMKVRELMVPVDHFMRISSESSFYEALLALEDAQKQFLAGEGRQRIVLVEDKDGNIVGKISPIDMIRGLENYDLVEVEKAISRFGLEYVKKPIEDEYRLWQTPFKDLCRKAASVKIKDFIKIPGE
ncbi:MAG: CBS domain-containing protein, partial [Thermodesulfobacteriota bacterium]